MQPTGGGRTPNIFSRLSIVLPSTTDTSGNVFMGLLANSGGSVIVDPLDSVTGTITMSLLTGIIYPVATKRITGGTFLTGTLLGLG